MSVDRFVSLPHFKMAPITSFAQQSCYRPPSPLTAISPSPTTALDMQRSLAAHYPTTPMVPSTMDVGSIFSMIATSMNAEGASSESVPAALAFEIARLVLAICALLPFLFFQYVKYKRSFARASDHVPPPDPRFSAREFQPGM